MSSSAIGVLIALFERAVGLYATLINVNAYHQPGVEAGKKAAGTVIELQRKIIQFLTEKKSPVSISEIAAGIGSSNEVETVFKVCEYLAANPRGILKNATTNPFESTYSAQL